MWYLVRIWIFGEVGSGGEIQESWMVQGFPNWGAYDMG
jgi:hypothetical protein